MWALGEIVKAQASIGERDNTLQTSLRRFIVRSKTSSLCR
jgi:hypothetical protein